MLLKRPQDSRSIQGLMSPQGTVAVVEDDASLLLVITSLFRKKGFRVRGFASAELLLESLEWSPDIDCIVSDIRLTGIDGVQLIGELRARGLNLPVVLLTAQSEVALAVRAMKAGACDFIEKPFNPMKLTEVVQEVIVRSTSVRIRSVEIVKAKRKLSLLTQRQSEIVGLICDGLTSKQIGIELNMSYRTVEAHRVSIMDKLGVHSMAELVKLRVMADLEQ